MPKVPKMTTITLYFPHIKDGTSSVGYTNLTIVDHYADLKYDENDSGVAVEAEMTVEHWKKNGATVTETVTGSSLEVGLMPEEEGDDIEVLND